MQMSKLLSAVCAVAFCAGFGSRPRGRQSGAGRRPRSADTEKMAAPDAQSEPTNNPAPLTATATEPQNPPATIPVPPVETPPATAAPVASAADRRRTSDGNNARQFNFNRARDRCPSRQRSLRRRASAALMEKMNQDAQTGQSPPVLINSSGVVPEPATQPAPTISEPPTNSIVAPAPPSRSPPSG